VGRRWKRLHQLIYVIGLLSVVHFLMQPKLENGNPRLWLVYSPGLAATECFSRAFAGRSGLPIWLVGALSLGTAITTAVAEAIYFWRAGA